MLLEAILSTLPSHSSDLFSDKKSYPLLVIFKQYIKILTNKQYYKHN